MKIELPYKWAPRDYQMPLWAALEGGKRYAVCVWHRRAGKDLCAFNFLATQAFRRRGTYWHCFPTYGQGRRALWNGMDRGGRPFLDAIPEELVVRKRDDNMEMWLHGGSLIQVVGTDHIDRLMGANPIGVVMSEYALQNPEAWEFISPILAENGGWAIFPYTPRGRNHGHDIFKFAEKHPESWFCEKLTVDDTKSISPEALAMEKERLPKEIFDQEYYCSFNASLENAYYKEQIQWLEDEKRITDEVGWIPDQEVITGWDLGHYDSTAIWFAQVTRNGIHLIDYHEDAGKTIDAYVKVLREKPYVYGDAFLPHDADYGGVSIEKTTLQQLRNLGVKCLVNVKHSESDQIDAVRLMLRQCWIHETKCKRGLQALKEFQKQRIPGERGPGQEVLYRDKALHNWASHGASALATLMMGFRPHSDAEFRQPDASYVT